MLNKVWAWLQKRFWNDMMKKNTEISQEFVRGVAIVSIV